MPRKISKNKIKKIISEEIEILRDERLLSELDASDYLDYTPPGMAYNPSRKAGSLIGDKPWYRNPVINPVGAGLEYMDRKTGGGTRWPWQDAPQQQKPGPDLGGYVNCNSGDGPPDIRPAGTCPQDQQKPDILPGEGEVKIKRGQGYYNLAKNLGLDPRNKETRGILRQLVSEKSPRKRSTLYTGRDYSWLRQHFTSDGQPRQTVGAMGTPAIAASAGPGAGMTRPEIGASQQAIKDIDAGDRSGGTVKTAAAIDSDYSKFTSFMTPDEVERLETAFNDPAAFSKVSAGEGNLMKQIKADEAAAETRKQELVNHAKQRVATLKDSYEGASLTSGSINMLAKRAGVLPDGKPNFAALERSIHDALNRKKMRKTGRTQPIKEY